MRVTDALFLVVLSRAVAQLYPGILEHKDTELSCQVTPSMSKSVTSLMMLFSFGGFDFPCVWLREVAHSHIRGQHGAIRFADNPFSSARSHRMDFRHHFLQENVAEGKTCIL